MNEFGIIERYFRRLGAARDDVLLGIGDDAALIRHEGGALVVCTDTMVGGVHFLPDDLPADIGFKSLAVNLSDIAAMGATATWATLSITLPEFDEEWIAGFCKGFDELAKRYRVALVGGDTTHGPLTVTVQVGGVVAESDALRRDGACAGQRVFLSGPVGDGALGLAVARGEYRANESDASYLLSRLRRPQPALRAGGALAGVARAAIDISDGLVADLRHVLDASGGRGAELDLTRRWFSPAGCLYLDDGGDVAPLLAGGDDYVLLFTIEEKDLDRLDAAARAGGFDPVGIGRIVDEPGIRIRDEQGQDVAAGAGGYLHFDGDDPHAE